MITKFFSPQAPMKRAWNPLLPQIFITEQCESLCERQIIFENPPVLTLGQKILVLYIGYMLISPYVMSLSVYFTIYIISRSGKEGSSLWRMTISMEVSHQGF